MPKPDVAAQPQQGLTCVRQLSSVTVQGRELPSAYIQHLVVSYILQLLHYFWYFVILLFICACAGLQGVLPPA